MIALIAAWCLALQDKPEKPKPLEANSRPCFADDQIPGSEYNAFWLDLKNVSKDDLDLTCVFENPSGGKVHYKLVLPRGSSQRVFAYLPPSGMYGSANIRVKVSDDSGTVLYDNEVVANFIGDPGKGAKVLVLADDAVSINKFMLPPSVRGTPVKATRCEPRNLPDSWIGLHGFHVVIVYQYDFTKLRPEQMKALADWVYAGGRLIVIPSHDPNSAKVPPLDELLPFKITGPETINDHATINQFFKLGSGGAAYPFYPVRGPEHLKFEDPKGPLLVWQDRGQGRVYFVAFDLMKNPFDDEREKFMLNVLNLATDNVNQDDVAIHRLQAVNRIVVPPPPIGTVLLIVVAFVVIVGPINYIVLFQRKRPIFSVITIPVISVAFAILVLVLGLVLRSGHRMANNVALIQTRSGDPAGYEMRLISLLSPTSRAYDFEFQGDTFLHTPSLLNDMNQSGAWNLSIEKLSDGMAIRAKRLQRFEGAQYYAHGVRSLGGGVEVRRENNTLILGNQSTYSLRRGVFQSSDGKFYEVDDLKAGVTGRKVELTQALALEKPAAYLGGSDPAALEAATSILGAKGPQAIYFLLDQDLGKVNVKGLPGAGTNDFIVLKVLLDR